MTDVQHEPETLIEQFQSIEIELAKEKFSGTVSRKTEDDRILKYYSSDTSVFTVGPDPINPKKFKGILRGVGMAFMRICVDGIDGNEQTVMIEVTSDKSDMTIEFDDTEEVADTIHRYDPNWRQLGNPEIELDSEQARTGHAVPGTMNDNI